jgi:hypothetical protein
MLTALTAGELTGYPQKNSTGPPQIGSPLKPKKINKPIKISVNMVTGIQKLWIIMDVSILLRR